MVHLIYDCGWPRSLTSYLCLRTWNNLPIFDWCDAFTTKYSFVIPTIIGLSGQDLIYRHASASSAENVLLKCFLSPFL